MQRKKERKGGTEIRFREKWKEIKTRMGKKEGMEKTKW